MKIPVILLNYNSSADCRKCVSFLQRQEGVELEIVVVDNCSHPDDRQAVETLCREQRLTYIPASENRGYNAGNNIGLRYAAAQGYEYALIANPDMEFPQTDYVARLADAIATRPDVAVAASDVLTPDGKHQNPQREVTFWEELFWPFTFWRNRKSGKWFMDDHTRSIYCEKVSGCCLMVQLSHISSCGFFDEHVFLYCEESILSKQVQRSKGRIFYLNGTYAVHCHIEKTKGDPAKRLQLALKSRSYYLRQYSGYSGIKLGLLLLSKWMERKFYNAYVPIPEK